MNTDHENKTVRACHEAGHSVVQKLLGIPMIAASLCDTGGKSELQYDLSKYDKYDRAAKLVMGLWAGPLAEELFLPPELIAGYPRRDNGFDSDNSQILALSATYGGAEPFDWVMSLREKTKSLLLANMRHVKDVAAELMLHGFSLSQFGALGAVQPDPVWSRLIFRA